MNIPSVLEQIGADIGKLCKEKNEQYGNSFEEAGKILKVLYPVCIHPDEYKDMLVMARVIDKLFRIANGDQGNESAWQDIAGYAILKCREKHTFAPDEI